MHYNKNLNNKENTMKTLALVLVLLLTGCATQNEKSLQACCKNMGGTASDNFYSSARPSGAYQVMTPAGGYLVVPNASTGRPMAVIQTSKGK
jgi:hypothetical protein